jgi:hypothetical protein
LPAALAAGRHGLRSRRGAVWPRSRTARRTLTAEAEDKRKDCGETRIVGLGTRQSRLVVGNSRVLSLFAIISA